MSDTILDNNSRRMIEGAQRYALGDRSDPFTLARCMAHIRQGICRPGQDGVDGNYNAMQATEERVTALGERYIAAVYRDMKRP